MHSYESFNELKEVLNSKDYRAIYDHFVDYMYDAKWYTGGMFESYGTILEFENIQNQLGNFTKYELQVLINTLRHVTFTPLALVLATFLELRVNRTTV